MVEIRTQADTLLDAIKYDQDTDLTQAAKDAGVDLKAADGWIRRLDGILEVNYSLNVLKKPTVKRRPLKKLHRASICLDIGGKQLEKYSIKVNGVPAEIGIHDVKGDIMRTYCITLPVLGQATATLLSAVIKDLAGKISTRTEEVSDPHKVEEMKKKFKEDARKKILAEMPVTEDQADILSGLALHRIYGLGDLELMLGDDLIEEICINSGGSPIIIYHRRYGWLKTNIVIQSEDDVFDYAAQIGRRIGKDITNLNPLMDARLITGDRVMASMFPISSQGNTITIRKFAREPWTIVDFMGLTHHTISTEIGAFMWLCIQYELSVLVAGGTASGKTSMLNSLCAFIPPGQRVISIEDTREIQLPPHLKLNWIQLTTRNPNADNLGGVSMLDLIISSLRMRPDRVIVGEIRDRSEAEVLFEAMHTGHSVYSTMHADTCQQVRRRVTEPPIHIPEAELESLQVIMTQYRDRLHGIRRTFEVAEILPGTTERRLELKYLYRWRVKTDSFEDIDRSTRVFNDLNLYTGMSVKEIEEDMRQKKQILDWLVGNKINKIDDIGMVMNTYYTAKDDLLATVNKKKGMEGI
ncbi:MAG: type II/IV secretion system ATPase subunit [Candidatus Altiarchaeota archaeon]